MKTLLLLLLTCLPLCAATTYPMLSTTTNRTITGGTTNLGFLNANQTFTGTNTFPAAGLFPANNIGLRLLWSSPTNIYLSTLSTTANPTNNGDFKLITYVCQASIPALLGSNSSIHISGIISKTNAVANLSAADIFLYAGSNTNYVTHGVGSLSSTASGIQSLSVAFAIMANANSFTSQIAGPNWSGTANATYGAKNYTDTSSPFSLYLGTRTTTGYSNLVIYGLRFYELYAP